MTIVTRNVADLSYGQRFRTFEMALFEPVLAVFQVGNSLETKIGWFKYF